MDIGKRIWTLRIARKMSRRQIAVLGGFSVDSLRRWEKNIRIPRINEFKKLAEVLGVKVEELLA